MVKAVPNIAILVANSEYKSLSKLPCCLDDVLAIKELLDATEKYSEIEIIENVEADNLKTRIRNAIDKSQPVGELFFYFTGHGFQHEAEFFYCATNFDSKRPNETGLSSSELHTLLKMANAELVVKVVDACNSGTLLVKADGGFASQHKHGFNNLIQIASCLESQNALTGNPLSVFTEKFRAAALRKPEGVVYYTDIIYALRDEFLQNNDQTPHFVSQGTGREQFVDSGKKLDSLRAKLSASVTALVPIQVEEITPPAPTLLALLESSEAKLATPERVQKFVAGLFDSLIAKLSTGEFAPFFEQEIVEHPRFEEDTARGFIIRVLSREQRPDNFVTATITHERNKPWSVAASLGLLGIGGDQSFSDVYDLELNCTMPRAQLKITFTPKYATLKRLVLVLTCAPSLEHCYVFELATQHSLNDFGKFNADGQEVIRRWYKMLWDESSAGVVDKIASKLEEVVRAHLQATAERLRSE